MWPFRQNKCPPLQEKVSLVSSHLRLRVSSSNDSSSSSLTQPQQRQTYQGSPPTGESKKTRLIQSRPNTWVPQTKLVERLTQSNVDWADWRQMDRAWLCLRLPGYGATTISCGGERERRGLMEVGGGGGRWRWRAEAHAEGEEGHAVIWSQRQPIDPPHLPLRKIWSHDSNSTVT